MSLAPLSALAILVAALATSASAQQRLTLTETLRLDANTEDFSTVNAAFSGPRGIVTVLLMQDYQLRLYDSTGKRIATVGRRGDGPGEFQRPLRFGWIADTLWVYDSSHQRFSLFTADGRLVRTAQLAAALNEGSRSGGMDSGAVYLFVPNTLRADGSSLGPGMIVKGRTPQGTIDTDNYIVRATAAGAIARLVESPSGDDKWSVNVSRAGSSYGQAVPFVHQSQTVYSHDGNKFGFLTVDITSRTGGTYTVRVYTANGEALLSRSYPFTGVEIPSGTIDSAINASMRRAQGNRPPDVTAELERGLRRLAPPVYSPISGMSFGRDGTIWITLRRTSDGIPTVVLNSRGDPIATVVAAPRIRFSEMSLSSIVATDTDADGLASVVRYRVSGRGCAPPECR